MFACQLFDSTLDRIGSSVPWFVEDGVLEAVSFKRQVSSGRFHIVRPQRQVRNALGQ